MAHETVIIGEKPVAFTTATLPEARGTEVKANVQRPRSGCVLWCDSLVISPACWKLWVFVHPNRGARVVMRAYRTPDLNTDIERFAQAFQQERLDQFLSFGQKHFDYLVRERLEHYRTEQPHQGLENRLVTGHSLPSANGEVRCRTRAEGNRDCKDTSCGTAP